MTAIFRQWTLLAMVALLACSSDADESLPALDVDSDADIAIGADVGPEGHDVSSGDPDALDAVDGSDGETGVDIAADTESDSHDAEPTCNGHAALCDRPFDRVAFAATHNSMSNGADGWILPNQNLGIAQQLDDGIRAFLIDTYEHNGELALCHSICEAGSIPLADALALFRDFLTLHPREVVSLLIQDGIDAATTAEAFEAAGLVEFTYVHESGARWPTLGEMIEANERLVVTAEFGGPPPSWYHHLWDIAYDTPYSFDSPEAFSCRLNRGQGDHQLFLLNHWLSDPFSSPESAATANEFEMLYGRAIECRDYWGRIPTFVAVDFYDLGDLFEVVDRLNGVAGTVEPGLLPVQNAPDSARVDAGLEFLENGWLGPGLAPRIGLRHVYLAWPGSLLEKASYFSDEEAFWADFRGRYGFAEAPWPNGGLPLGLRDGAEGMVSVDCLSCHAGQVPGGGVRIGLGSGRVDLEGLHDDLVALPAAVEALKAQRLPEPYARLLDSVPIPDEIPEVEALDGTTGAAGASDGLGLGVALGFELLDADRSLNRHFGFQDPPAWFTHRNKTRMYTDGSVEVGAHRTMMATALANGMSWSDIAASDSTFEDVAHALRSLPVPRWEVVRPEPLQHELAAAGRAVFEEACASCHGTYDSAGGEYPAVVVPAEDVGTDPVRATNLGRAEAEAINALMLDADSPMTPTGGYLAPPLLGVWATSPYLHNGSVPDLASLLAPDERPTYWRRVGTGPQDFDADRVGWRVEPLDAGGDTDTVVGRRVYDTTREGLSNAGHLYGSDLSRTDRAALLEYLKTL